MKDQIINIFIADDHHVFREGIRLLLENDPLMKIVGEAANGPEVLTKLAASDTDIDILLLDIDMPEINGMELMKPIMQKYLSLPILVFSSHDDEQFINHMITAGAKGYLVKNCRKSELVLAIKTVSAGGTYLSEGVMEKLLKVENSKDDQISIIPLTDREVEVLKLVANGMTNQEIGEQLFISHRTVDTHRRNMMTKLDLHNAVALTNYAAKMGLLENKELHR